jgi:cell division protein FtsL
VKPRTPAQRRRLAFFVVASALVGLMVFGVVSLQALVSQTSFRMQELTSESASLRASYGQLKLEVAELSAPERIVAEARRLGLIVPDEVHAIRVKSLPSSRYVTGPPNDGISFALERAAEEDP